LGGAGRTQVRGVQPHTRRKAMYLSDGNASIEPQTTEHQGRGAKGGQGEKGGIWP